MKRKIKMSRVLILLMIPLLCIGWVSVHFVYDRLTKQEEVIAEKKDCYQLNSFVMENGWMTYKDTSYTSMTGVDVSSHNESIDWSAVKKEGIDFAMLRVGYRGAQEGILHEDELFDKNAKEATQNYLNIGVYFFSSAISAKEIDEEVQFVLSKISPYTMNMPVVFDMEEFDQGGRIDDLSTKQRTNLALRFCQKIKEAGYTPMIYGNMTWLYENYNFEKISKYPIWLASYSKKCPMKDQFDMWQYSNTGKVNGIEGDVDIDLYLKKK